MGKDGCDYSRIRLFWYVTKITLRWNVVQSCIFDIFELCGLWLNQEESYEGVKSSIRIIFYQDKWCLQIIISRGHQVGFTTQKVNQINLRYYQEDVYLYTMPVVM